MNKKLLFIVVTNATLSFTCLSSALAETISSTGDLQRNKKALAYVYSPSMLETLRSIGVEQDKKLGLQVACKSEHAVKPNGAMVLSPISFSEDKQNPVKGSWQIRYQIEGCGKSKIYNVSFTANSSGKMPTSKLDYPGSTLANPIIFHDAIGAATIAALYKSGQSNDCKDAHIFDTHVTEPPHNIVGNDKTVANVWNETWTFKLCDKMVEIPIIFTQSPDGRGVKYDIPVKP